MKGSPGGLDTVQLTTGYWGKLRVGETDFFRKERINCVFNTKYFSLTWFSQVFVHRKHSRNSQRTLAVSSEDVVVINVAKCLLGLWNWFLRGVLRGWKYRCPEMWSAEIDCQFWNSLAYENAKSNANSGDHSPELAEDSKGSIINWVVGHSFYILSVSLTTLCTVQRTSVRFNSKVMVTLFSGWTLMSGCSSGCVTVVNHSNWIYNETEQEMKPRVINFCGAGIKAILHYKDRQERCDSICNC